MSLIYVKFDTHPLSKLLARLETFVKYRMLRPVISFLAWHVYGKMNFRQNNFNTTGEPLWVGISIIIPAKNEEYTLNPCLESLIGIADQFILIDNGSEDRTLEIMMEFAESMKDQCEVIVLERPGASLIEMRQEGLNYVKYNWVIRGDADMVFTEEMKKIKTYALKQKRAAAIYLRKLNVYGDLEHINRLHSPFSGEYFLRNYEKGIKFIEYYGRLEHAPLPIYYRMISWGKTAFFHIDCSKPNDRLVYRTCYLDWREAKNKIMGTPEFEKYQKLWTLHNFGTLDKKSLQYRYARLIASACMPLSGKTKETLPEPLKKQIEKEPFKFYIEYRDGKPFLRHDRQNPETTNYKPSAEDESWQPSMERFKSDKIRKGFQIHN